MKAAPAARSARIPDETRWFPASSAPVPLKQAQILCSSAAEHEQNQKNGGQPLGFLHKNLLWIRMYGMSCFRRPYLFRLTGKDRGKRGVWLRFGVYCGYDLGKHLFYSRCEHAKSPYEPMIRAACYGTPNL